MELTIVIIKGLIQLCGLFLGWWPLWFLLLDIVICKDAKTFNKAKFNKMNRRRKWKVFIHSLRSNFYSASVILFIGTSLALFKMTNEIMNNYQTFDKSWFWLSFHIVVSIGIHKLYNHYGYKIPLLTKFKLYWAGKEF